MLRCPKSFDEGCSFNIAISYCNLGPKIQSMAHGPLPYNKAAILNIGKPLDRSPVPIDTFLTSCISENYKRIPGINCPEMLSKMMECILNIHFILTINNHEDQLCRLPHI